MSAFQVCARCATRWPVGTRPAVWCPRCHGILLSPVSSQAPATGQRNFKWVARRPKSKSARPPRPHRPRRTETPKYDEIPRWGLIDRPVTHAQEREPRLQRWASAAPGLLVLVGALLGVAAVAELFRYGILLHNRTRLVGQRTLVASDALVLFAEIASVVIGIAAAVASACWLVSRRRAMFERSGTRDPRSVRAIFVGSLVPVLSLVMPGVFLTELVDARGRTDRDRLRVLVRVWWAAWVVNWALVLVASLWRLRDSLQAQANGVLFSAILALVAASVAFLTIHLMRRIDGLGWRGIKRKAPTRWVAAIPRTAATPNAATVPRETEAPDAASQPDAQPRSEQAESVPARTAQPASAQPEKREEKAAVS